MTHAASIHQWNCGVSFFLSEVFVPESPGHQLKTSAITTSANCGTFQAREGDRLAFQSAVEGEIIQDRDRKFLWVRDFFPFQKWKSVAPRISAIRIADPTLSWLRSFKHGRLGPGLPTAQCSVARGVCVPKALAHFVQRSRLIHCERPTQTQYK